MACNWRWFPPSESVLLVIYSVALEILHDRVRFLSSPQIIFAADYGCFYRLVFGIFGTSAVQTIRLICNLRLCHWCDSLSITATTIAKLLLLLQMQQAVREAATICPRPMWCDLWPFDLESGVRVTCDVGYIWANFSLHRPLCSRLRPDVRDRQTSDSVID